MLVFTLLLVSCGGGEPEEAPVEEPTAEVEEPAENRRTGRRTRPKNRPKNQPKNQQKNQPKNQLKSQPKNRLKNRPKNQPKNRLWNRCTMKRQCLAEMVAAGELPPVDERLPAEPLVEEVVDEIGQYGGTLRRGFTGPGDHNNYTRVVYDALVRHAPDGSQVIPHIAKGWESNDDFTEWTVFLREGMKWSDGAPFTADDIMFWYENILLNEDLNPTTPVWMQNADGSVATVEKIDETTVKWTFGQPNTAFLLDLANKDGADKAIPNLAFVPAHYLKDFHPDFADEAELQAKVDEAGFDTWVELFAVQAMPHVSGATAEHGRLGPEWNQHF